MSEFVAVKELSSTADEVRVRLPDADRRILIARIAGTFVGTLKLQTSDDGKAWTDGSVFTMGAATNANPTGVGVYATILGASAVAGRVIFSAYTSGTARVEAGIVRQSA